MHKISVIIPVYGVEQYIEQCARSLFGQTLDDIEFIFVNDCTPDKSIFLLERILKDYPHRQHLTKIIHHDKNMGLPTARLSGIKKATGEYIAHCDSDDWVDLNLYENAYKKAKLNDADVVIYDAKKIEGKECHTTILKNYSNAEDYIMDMMYKKTWWSLCNKLIKRDIYNNAITYPLDAMGEDMCLTLQLSFYCKVITNIHNLYYYYRSNPHSIIKKQDKSTSINKYEQICRNVEILKTFYSPHKKYLGGLNFLDYNTQFSLLSLIGYKKYYHIWRNKYKQCNWDIISDKKVPFKERVRALLILLKLFPIPQNKYQIKK